MRALIMPRSAKLLCLSLSFLVSVAFTEQSIEDIDEELGIDGEETRTGLDTPSGLPDSSAEPSLPDRGPYTIELVTWDDPKVPVDAVTVNRLFDRGLTAVFWTLDLRLDNQLVTPPDARFDEDRGQVLSLKSGRKTDLTNGLHRFTPGDATLEADLAAVTSRSPAVVIDGETIRLRLVPVTFESTDAGRTRWFPTRMKLLAGDIDLMKRFEKVGPPIARYPAYRLTMYLPAGQKYNCSWGSFTITSGGEVRAERIGHGVRLEGRKFLRIQEAEPRGKAVQWFAASCGEIRAYGPLLLPAGGEATLVFGAQPGGAPPEGKLIPYALDQRPVALELVPAEPPKHIDDLLVDEGLACSAFKTRIDTTQTGLMKLEVQFRDGRFVRNVAVIDPDATLHLFTRRNRTAYLNNETIECRIVLSPPEEGHVELVLIEEGRPDTTLGTFSVRPGRPQTVLAHVAARKLRPGDYRLVARSPGAQSRPVPLAIRSAARRSNLLVSNITICTAGWTEEPEWAAPARQAAIGFEMLTRAGHYGYSYPTIGQPDRWVAAALRDQGLPQDYAVIPPSGANFLNECVRHRVGYLDYISVYRSWYNEGLSVHHSYPPDVARWIRREQVMFGAGADYPSLWGVNYTWFPRLFGYVEAGVDTDIHKYDRNRILSEKLDAQGYGALTGSEAKAFWDGLGDDTPETREKVDALKGRQIGRVRGYADAFYQHFKMYAERIKEIRPDGIAVAFENAGHDGATGGNYLPKFYGGLDAATMEAYTDFGDWALEPAFTADWVRAAMKSLPDRQRPFWLAAEWGAPPPVRFGYLLQAVGRRVEGTSYPFPSKWPATMDRTVGNMVRFLKAYGGVQPFVEVEPEIAILCSFDQMAFSPRAIYDYHAAYYELTRAQYPPQCMYQETVERGGLRDSGIKLLFIIKHRVGLPRKVLEEIREFQGRGGAVVLDSLSTLPLEGAQQLSYSSKNIWEPGMGGFGREHRLTLWDQYLDHRDELKAVLRGKVRPYAQSDNERIITSTLTGGQVRFVFAVNDCFDPDKPENQLNVWHRRKDVPLRVRDEDAAVYDLMTMERLTGEQSGGRLLLKLDLFNRPGLILAALPEPIAAITTDAPAEARLGDDLFVRSRLIGESGKPIDGPTPVRYVLRGPAGKERETLYRAAGVDDAALLRLAANDEPGKWRLEVTDMVSGRQMVAPIRVAAAEGAPGYARAAGPVLVPREMATRKFLTAKEEKLILLEEDQRYLKPLAERLAEAVRKSGGAIRIVELNPTKFAEIPMRWYPSPTDQKHYQEIEAAGLVGVRRSMKAYVEPKTRRHIPALGGYGAITPEFIVRHPNIVFSGGRLAASLREIIPYTFTADDPGPGNAVLALAFSAFEARQHTLAILASDMEGYEAGVNKAIEILNSPSPALPHPHTPTPSSPLPFRLSPTSPHYTGVTEAAHQPSTINHPSRWRAASGRSVTFRHPIADEFVGFFTKFVAVNQNGDALLQPDESSRRVLLGRNGEVLGAVEEPKGTLQVRLSDDAKSIFFAVPGDGRVEWMKPLAGRKLVAECRPDGTLRSMSVLYPEPGNDYAEGQAARFTGYFAVGRNSRDLFLTREGGLTVGPAEGPHRLYSHAPHFRDFRETHSPDWPMAFALSGDGRTLAISTWAHPTANSMGGPLFMLAMSPEIVAIDTATLKTVWKVAPPEDGTWDHAPQRGCIRVNSDGTRVGYVGGQCRLYVIGRDGKTLWSKSLAEAPASQQEYFYPDRFEMGEDGLSALVTYEELGGTVFVRKDEDLLRFEPPPPASAMAPDGRFVFGQSDGALEAFSSTGKREWSKTLASGRAALASAGARGFVMGPGDGSVEMWSWAGERIWRTPGEKLVALTAAQIRATEAAAVTTDLPSWPISTLENLKQYCGARLVAEPSDARTVKAPATSKMYDVHLAYRKPEGNPPVTLTLTDGTRREVFTLDLPTPYTRTQDLAWPGRGRPLSVEVKAPAGVEVSALQVWEFEWPSPNLAYVRPAGAASAAGEIELGGEDDTGLDDLEGEDLETEESRAGQGVYGKMKDAFVRVRNPDPDQVAGPWLAAMDNPLNALDGKLYSANGGRPWYDKEITRGLWFELDFGKQVELDLLAFYSHTNRQSELIRSVGFMSFVGQKGRDQPLHHDEPLALAIHNDQFFLLLAAPGSKCSELRCYLGQVRKHHGASEIEVYKARR